MTMAKACGNDLGGGTRGSARRAAPSGRIRFEREWLLRWGQLPSQPGWGGTHPGVSPRIISDNGPQFIAGDFKQYIRLTGMTHVRTSPYYAQPKSSRPAADRALAHDPQG
jgi:hypothetical protein